MVSPNAGLHKEDKLLYPDHHLIWIVESGFRPAQLQEDYKQIEVQKNSENYKPQPTLPLQTMITIAIIITTLLENIIAYLQEIPKTTR